MSELVASGLLADLALAIIVLEAAVIFWVRRAQGVRILVDIGPFLAAGAGLLIALRAALVGWPPTVIVAALALAGVAHCVDLARRLRA